MAARAVPAAALVRRPVLWRPVKALPPQSWRPWKAVRIPGVVELWRARSPMAARLVDWRPFVVMLRRRRPVKVLRPLFVMMRRRPVKARRRRTVVVEQRRHAWWSKGGGPGIGSS